ncbi:glutamate receptor-interacting protein 1 isoform X2 [Patella vulgata]|uniref:glutamate receptor-interacting protein 1 isoform X2 n=1 Tax=Patella vulgata TaxID=6465 RepID=UPI002180083F|nr:glutamate receptor-interacting protein 1 isoform X2 [Patella vulgata]
MLSLERRKKHGRQPQSNPIPLNIVGTDSGINGSQDIDEERKGISFVELQKKEGCGLGLTVSGGTDKGCLAQVSNLRPGGIAHRSDALALGDYIISVNGIRTANLKHDEIINLLKNAEEMLILEIEYELPESALNSFSVHSKCQDVTLPKEGTGFGFLLRGGMFIDTMKAHPLIVTNIRPGGPADREGSIKEGDRIIAMNGYRVTHLSLMETMTLIHQVEQEATFSVEYDVSVMEAVQNANGPLLVEIDKSPGSSLGINLSQSSHMGRRCVCVDCIHSMSVADRSGALHEGDHILSIDGASVEHMSVAEATQLLKAGNSEQIRLEILPVSHLQHQANREYMAKNALLPACSTATLPSISPSSSSFNGFGSMPGFARSSLSVANNQYGTLCSVVNNNNQYGTLSSKGSGRSKRNWLRPADRKPSSCMSIASAATSVLVSNNQVCHPESTEIVLFTDHHRGIGLQLDGGIFSTAVLTDPPLVAMIEPNSPAEKCGLIQVGDRLLSVNGIHVADKILDEVNQLLRDCRPRCVLEIEFDVTESVTMSSGTYCVKIPKPAGGLGMTINAPLRRKIGDPLIITNVKKASVAYRSGSVQPGDHLLAINDIRTEHCSVEDAAHLLQMSEDIIKLKIKREDPYTVEGSADSVTYTVELQRFGGPLGITISGTEDPMDTIYISHLIEGGLAERTGAIRVKDHLLAINGKSTKYKRLSEAIEMLQNAGDVVTLKISRKMTDKKNHSRNHGGNKSDLSKPPTPSMDSALESWDSSGPEMGSGNIGNINQPKLNSASRQKLPEKRRKSDYRPFSGESSNDAEGSGEGLADLQMSDGEWDNHSDSNHSFSSSNQEEDWVGTFEDFMHGSGSEMLKQIGLSLRDRSTASLDRRSRASEPSDRYSRSKSAGRFGRSAISHDSLSLSNQNSRISNPVSGGKSISEHVQTIFTPTPIQLHRITVVKSYATEDFGFGLSDGMYEKGVFISGVRPGSAASKAGLKAFDRILQVNRHKTKDYDCSLTVPLIAESGNKLHMIVCRNPLLRHRPTGCQDKNSVVKDDRLYMNAKEDRLYVNAYDTTGASDTSNKTV